MYHESKLKISHLKVGGSPLYLIEGQEARLDNFTKHLAKKEQEALDHLKKEQILNDEKLEPSHRVALRNIKDFAIMMKITQNDQEKIFWRIHTLSKSEAEKKLREILKIKPRKKEIKREEKREIRKEIKKEIKREEEKPEIKAEKAGRPKKSRKRIKKEDVELKVQSYLNDNNLSIIKEIREDDIFGIVTSSTQLGKLKFLVIYKNKKKINDADITLALHAGQKNKTPVLLLTPGKLTKKAEKYVEENEGYLIIRNINL